MIIKTRYRDITFREVKKCFHAHAIDGMGYLWRAWRGKEIEIETPAVPDQWQYFKCAGPHYRVITHGRNSGACPHIAEIGD